MDKLTPVSAERTMQLCQAVIDYMESKLTGEKITTTPLLLAIDIRKELKEKKEFKKIFRRGQKVRCVKNDRMDDECNIAEKSRWHIGDEFIVKNIEVLPWGTFLFDGEGHDLNANRAEIIEQGVENLSPKEIEAFIWLKLAYSESNTDFFDWLIKNFDIKQKENEN